MNCGTIFKESSTPKAEPLNTKTPVQIAKNGIWFEQEMKKVEPNWLGAGKNMILRHVTVAFQLLDESDKTTASGGTFKIKVKFWQTQSWSSVQGQSSYTYVTNNAFDKEIRVNANDFYRASGDGGRIWYKYENPDPFKISTEHSVSGEIEIWFTPNGSSKQLYKKDTFSLSST